MTKHIILFFAALCSLHNHANAAPSDSDTVRYEVSVMALKCYARCSPLILTEW